MKTKRQAEPTAEPPTVAKRIDQAKTQQPPTAVFVALRRRECATEQCNCDGYIELALMDGADGLLATCPLDKDAARWISEHLALYAGKPSGAVVQ